METGQKQAGIVLLTEELERRCVLEWVNVILLGEVDCGRLLESVLVMSARPFYQATSKIRTKSFITTLTFSLVWFPRTKMAVFSFSTALGSRSSSARLTLAFFGLLQTSALSGLLQQPPTSYGASTWLRVINKVPTILSLVPSVLRLKYFRQRFDPVHPLKHMNCSQWHVLIT